jgi:tetratricopeptide (TPR) repeat protein
MGLVMRKQSMICNSRNFIAVLLLFVLTSAASAEWYKDYEAAMDLMKKGRTEEAISRLQSAIAQKDQEGLNIKFYGMKFDDYLPHYFLGKAYFSQKNYAAALSQFEASIRQGQIQRNQGLFQNLNEMQTLAKAQINPVTPVPEREKPKPVTPEQEKPKPVIPEQEKPKPVTPEPPKVEPKKPDSEPAVRVPEPAKNEPELTPKPTEIQPAPTPEELILQKTKLMVKDGARKYFQGDFDSAISSFSTALQMTPGEFSAQFLLGCSYAAKYLLSGSQDKDSFDRATVAFRQSRKMNSNHPLTKSDFISPAIREIYQKSGA